MIEINEKKEEFRNSLFFNNAWRDSVQHGKKGTSIYSEFVNSESSKIESRDQLRKIIETEYIEKIYLKHSVTEEEHYTNISELHKTILTMKNTKNEFTLFSEDFNIGRVQKLLNMLLKYYWSCGVMEYEPCHMPIDSIIIKSLTKDSTTKEQKEKLKVNWTEIATIDEYKRIIQVAKEIVKAKNYESLTAYELVNWSSQ